VNQLGGFPILTLLVVVPVLGALLSLLIRAQRRETLRWLTLLVAATDLFIALFLYMGWVNDVLGGYQFVDGPWPWIPSLGIEYHLGVDGLSLHAVLLAAALVQTALLVAWSQDRDPTEDRPLAFWMLLFEGTALGGLTSLTPFLMAVFWLSALVAATFLVAHETHSPGAARLMGAIAAISGVLWCGGLIGLWRQGPSEGDLSLWSTQVWTFWAMAVAASLGAAAWPLHLWYVNLARERMPVIHILLGGILVNLGLYALVRFCLPAVPLAVRTFAPVFVLVGSAGIAWLGFAALGATTPTDVIVRWELAQVCLSLVGIFCLNRLALYGAVIAMSARGLHAALLSLLSAADPSGSRAQTRLERGVWSLSVLSAAGLPGLAGFASLAPTLLGLLRWHWQWSASPAVNQISDWATWGAVVTGLLLSTWALIRIRPPRIDRADTRPARSSLIALPMLAAALFLGLRIAATSDIVGPTVHRLLAGLIAQGMGVP